MYYREKKARDAKTEEEELARGARKLGNKTSTWNYDGVIFPRALTQPSDILGSDMQLVPRDGVTPTCPSFVFPLYFSLT